MAPLTYLADLCAQIDRTYSVSLEYGAHVGNEPCWQMHVRLPFKAISLSRQLVRGDDIQANTSAAQSMAQDLQRFLSSVKDIPGEEMYNLDTYNSP